MRILALTVMFLAGAAQAATTPEQLTIEYMAALKKDGITAAATYIHPDELERFKQMLLPLFKREAANQDRPFTDALFGKGTALAKVEAMSGAEFMTALMRVVGEQLKGVNFGDVQVLGSVTESDVVHVVTRVSAEAPGGLKVKSMEVISAKQFGKEWKLLLTGELEGLAAALSRQ